MISARYLVLCLSLFFCLRCYPADEGKAAPEFSAKLFSGEKFFLKAVSGQVVILHFWATWCEPCRLEMPVLDAYYKQHRAEGLQMIAISMDEAKDESKARDAMKAFSFNAAMAKEASYKSYGRIWRLPLTFVIDRKGILRKDGWIQEHTLNPADLEKTVTPLLKLKSAQ